jgi:hypothetical protein
MSINQDNKSCNSFSLKRSQGSLSLGLDDQDDISIASVVNCNKSISPYDSGDDSLPTWWHFSNGHTMINKDRSLANVPLLYRSRRLDALARAHAQHMANVQVLSHSIISLEELREKLHSETVGENIQRGSTVSEMYRSIMFDRRHSVSRLNIMSNQFNEFGVGTAKSSDGTLYMVQLFRQSQE